MASPDNINELMKTPNNYITYECNWIDCENGNKQRACYFCNKILNNTCYAFVQWHEHYLREIMFLACNDQCPVAMQAQSSSNCVNCKRKYIYNRYDGAVCANCNRTNAV